MTTGLPAIATMVLAVVLLALTLWRWRENGTGALVWLAAFVATVAIRTPYSLRNRRNRIVEASKGSVEMLLLVGMFATTPTAPRQAACFLRCADEATVAVEAGHPAGLGFISRIVRTIGAIQHACGAMLRPTANPHS